MLQKMGALYTRFSQRPWPIPHTSKKKKSKKKKFTKNGTKLDGQGVDPRPAGDRWSPIWG
jgi:hypothetical protein